MPNSSATPPGWPCNRVFCSIPPTPCLPLLPLPLVTRARALTFPMNLTRSCPISARSDSSDVLRRRAHKDSQEVRLREEAKRTRSSGRETGGGGREGVARACRWSRRRAWQSRRRHASRRGPTSLRPCFAVPVQRYRPPPQSPPTPPSGRVVHKGRPMPCMVKATTTHHTPHSQPGVRRPEARSMGQGRERGGGREREFETK